ncbi:MAG: hypothetical protein HY925_11030 [Elusimicrobia bacterium]|nr:hypothetical protein [Elusimicrobiota bacterium]
MLKTSCILLGLLVVAIPSSAREVFFKKNVSVDRLKTELQSAGFVGISIDCKFDACSIKMPDSEKRNPLPIVRAHKRFLSEMSLGERRAAAAVLVDRLRGGALPQPEKDQLLLMLAEIVLAE